MILTERLDGLGTAEIVWIVINDWEHGISAPSKITEVDYL